MLARALRLLTLAWGGALLCWLVLFLGKGRPGWALGGAAAIAGLHAAVLGVEFLLQPWLNRRDPAPAANAQQRLRAWWTEVRTAMRVFGWEQAYREWAEPDHLPPDSVGRCGVVLVHGFVCNRGIWNPWMQRLRARSVPFVAVTLEPVLGSIDAYLPSIDAAVRRMKAQTGERVLVVAHSMGGLAVRAWLAQQGDAPRLVHHVVTVATPHQGTSTARIGQATNVRQMRPGSAWLRTLAQREGRARVASFTCFYSHCDNVVMPASSATLSGAGNRHVPGAAHVDLLYAPEVFDAVIARLTATRSGASSVPDAP